MIEPGDSAQWWVDRSFAVHPDMHCWENRKFKFQIRILTGLN